MSKHMTDAARTLRRLILNPDHVLVVFHDRHVWATDSYVALRLNAIRAMPLVGDLLLGEPVEGTYSLSIGKGLVPNEAFETFSGDGIRHFLDGMLTVGEWVEAIPSKWSYSDSALLESDAGPAWANHDFVAAWQQTSRALDLAAKWYRQSAEAGALRPLRIESATSPRARYRDGRPDERRRETVAFVMPVRVEDATAPRLDVASAVPAASR